MRYVVHRLTPTAYLSTDGRYDSTQPGDEHTVEVPDDALAVTVDHSGRVWFLTPFASPSNDGCPCGGACRCVGISVPG